MTKKDCLKIDSSVFSRPQNDGVFYSGYVWVNCCDNTPKLLLFVCNDSDFTMNLLNYNPYGGYVSSTAASMTKYSSVTSTTAHRKTLRFIRLNSSSTYFASNGNFFFIKICFVEIILYPDYSTVTDFARFLGW